MATTSLQDEAAAFLQDVLYGSTKELTRALLVSCCTILVQRALRKDKTPRHGGGGGDQLKLAGAAGLLALSTSLFVSRVVVRCQSGESSTSLCFIVSSPPPPPPPPPPRMSRELSVAAGRAVAWCRAHPLQLASAATGLLLADALNLFIALDAADPFVRAVMYVGRPLRRAASAAWALLLRQRAATLRMIGGAAGL